MKKRLNILCATLIVGFLTGCTGEASHEHTFDLDSWQSSKTHHWHNATCDHTDLASSLGEHIFDADGKCSVCGYKEYTISYLNWPTGIENPNPTTADRNTIFTLDGSKILEKTGFSNVKFFVNSQEVTSLSNFNDDVSVTVTYDVTVTTVHLDFDGQVAPSVDLTLNVNYWSILDDLIEVEVTKEDHTFMGWYDTFNNKIETSQPWSITDEEVTLIAKWKYDDVDNYLDELNYRCESFLIELAASHLFDDKIDDFISLMKQRFLTVKNGLTMYDYQKEQLDPMFSIYVDQLNREIIEKAKDLLRVKLKSLCDNYKTLITGSMMTINSLESALVDGLSAIQDSPTLSAVINSYNVAANAMESIYTEYVN